MPVLSKRTSLFSIFAFVAGALICGGIYSIYLSPSGWKARQNAVLSQITSEDVISYTSLDGTEVDFSKFDGDVLVVNVWASWSPYTKADHTVLRALKERFGERITIRALNRMEPQATAEAYLQSIGKEPGIEYGIDTTDHLYDSLGGFAMPETIVFDSIGNVVFHKRGVLQETEIVAEIEPILNIES